MDRSFTEDDVFLNVCLKTSEEYVSDGITDLEEKLKLNPEIESKIDMIKLILISGFYDERDYTVSIKDYKRNKIIECLISQLENMVIE